MTHWTAKENDGKNVFVYGANEQGIHGLGAAKDALLYWGAKIGHYGRMGMSYGIPTKDRYLRALTLNRITSYVVEFITYSKEHPELQFLVTPIGTGYAGYSHAQIAPMFKNAPKNCVLPEEWRDLICNSAK